MGGLDADDFPWLTLAPAGLARTGWAGGQEVRMWDSTFIEYWGTAEREGKERVCHCATYQAPEAAEEGRVG